MNATLWREKEMHGKRDRRRDGRSKSERSIMESKRQAENKVQREDIEKVVWKGGKRTSQLNNMKTRKAT